MKIEHLIILKMFYKLSYVGYFFIAGLSRYLFKKPYKNCLFVYIYTFYSSLIINLKGRYLIIVLINLTAFHWREFYDNLMLMLKNFLIRDVGTEVLLLFFWYSRETFFLTNPRVGFILFQFITTDIKKLFYLILLLLYCCSIE